MTERTKLEIAGGYEWPRERELAAAWFRALRDQIGKALETLEAEAPANLYGMAAGKFEILPWKRGDGTRDEGGGDGGILKGRLFEKAGVHVSTVYGDLPQALRDDMTSASAPPRFWAGGISVIVHPKSPRVPAVHMNTRMIVTNEIWFGGGADLTPLLTDQRRADHADAKHFHAVLEKACARHGADYYQRFKTWCDEYFYLPHRKEPRGIGGIFYDQLKGDWEKTFVFTQDVGRSFLDAYLPLVRKRMGEPWTEAEREEQLIRRGRYVEFNLLYDKGTSFGLKTGGNVETILSSLPPVVKWP